MRKLVQLALLSVPACAAAGPLVYQPVNPSFGGNPLNGPNLMNQANAQNKLTDPAASSLFGRSSQGQLDLFNQRLQSLILDRIASSLSDGLFDANGDLKAGVVDTSTFRIEIVDQGNGTLLITTTDKSTGASTSFQVSQ
ncbi:MAG TPA: curli assembly protein CsgF [Steroidobacteraceae bacterium]